MKRNFDIGEFEQEHSSAQEIESARLANIERGTASLREKDLDIDEYRRYFDWIERNYVQVGNYLTAFTLHGGAAKKGSGFETFKELSDEIDLMINNWKNVLDVYEKMDMSVVDENVGGEAIREMAKLVIEFDKHLKEWKENVSADEEIQPPSTEAEKCKRQMDSYIRIIAKSPAFVCYKEVGRHERKK